MSSSNEMHTQKKVIQEQYLFYPFFATLTFLPQRAIVSFISYRVTRVRVTKVVMIHDDLLTQSRLMALWVVEF